MVAEARGVARRAALVVRVVRFRALCCRLLLLAGFSEHSAQPCFSRVAVHFARDELTLAVFLAASQGFLFSRLIVASAIPIASQAVTTVAFRRPVGSATVIAIAIIDDDCCDLFAC